MGTAVPRGKGVPAVPSAGGSPRGTGGAGEGRRGMKGSVRGAATAPRDPQPSPFPPAALKARPAPGRAAGPWPRCGAGPDCRPCCCCCGFASVTGKGNRPRMFSIFSNITSFPTVFCCLLIFLLTYCAGADFIFVSGLSKSNCSEGSGVAQA